MDPTRSHRDALHRAKQIAHFENKVRTAFIFAIAEMEKQFGYLWGHDNGGPQTTSEKEFYYKFQDFRKKVLDKGNNQIRELGKDLGRML